MRNSVWILAIPGEIKTIAKTLFFLIPELKFSHLTRITAINYMTNEDLNSNEEILKSLPNAISKGNGKQIISIFIDKNLSLAFSTGDKKEITYYLEYQRKIKGKVKFFNFTLNNRKEELIKLINWILNEDC